MRQSDKETKRPAGLCSEPHRQAVTAEGPPSAEWTGPGVPALIPGLQATPTPAGPVHRDCQVPALCRVSLQVEGTQRRAPRSGWPCLRGRKTWTCESCGSGGGLQPPPPGVQSPPPSSEATQEPERRRDGLSSTPRPTPTSPGLLERNRSRVSLGQARQRWRLRVDHPSYPQGTRGDRGGGEGQPPALSLKVSREPAGMRTGLAWGPRRPSNQHSSTQELELQGPGMEVSAARWQPPRVSASAPMSPGPARPQAPSSPGPWLQPRVPATDAVEQAGFAHPRLRPRKGFGNQRELTMAARWPAQPTRGAPSLSLTGTLLRVEGAPRIIAQRPRQRAGPSGVGWRVGHPALKVHLTPHHSRGAGMPQLCLAHLSANRAWAT